MNGFLQACFVILFQRALNLTLASLQGGSLESPPFMGLIGCVLVGFSISAKLELECLQGSHFNSEESSHLCSILVNLMFSDKFLGNGAICGKRI